MTPPRIIQFESLEALRAAAGDWDDLWQRSSTTLPTLRAELVAQWVEHFARPEDFLALAVEHNGRLAAGLPLVRRRIGHLLTAMTLPCNEWSSSGDLLLDASLSSAFLTFLEASDTATPSADVVLDVLLTALRDMPGQLLWLDEVVPDNRPWRQLQLALTRRAVHATIRSRWQAGRVPLTGDWDAYKASWSRKHRQKMAAQARHLRKCGAVQLTVASHLAPAEVAEWMERGFAIEDRSWKGPAGTSVLRTPGMREFFVRQAEWAARWGQLELVFLECAGRAVAFAYGLTAKGVFHSLKIGYDAEYARYAPGQLLRYFMLERFFAEPHRTAVDFQGPLTPSHRAWRPETYNINRLAIAPRRLWGRIALQAYQHWWPATPHDSMDAAAGLA